MGLPVFAVANWAGAASTLPNGLISYWKLDEASGVGIDSVGANTLTDTNTVTSAAGKVGTARLFTAANSESLDGTDNASLSTGDIDFTLSAWVYFTTLGNSVIVNKWNTTAQREYLFFYNATDHAPNARFSFLVSPDGNAPIATVDAITFGAPSTATWYHVCAWHDSVANTINICVNNGTVDSVAHTTGVFDSTSLFKIGRLSASTYFFNGRIDDMKFWKRVLTVAERAEDYANGLAGLPLL